jgi:autotransporter-associated beta strand protein
MKFKTILISASWLAIHSSEALYGASLVWNNSASTGNWNSSDANWTSSSWNSFTPDDAVVENRSETITLTEPITAGAITVSNGGQASGPHTLLFTGSSMSATGITFNGAGLGGSVDSIFAPNANPAFNQILRLDSVNVTVAGNILFTRGTLEISGTSAVTVTGGIGVVPGGAWQNLTLRSPATLTTSTGVDLRTVGSYISLRGTLTTPFLWGNATTFSGGTQVFINGGTLIPTGNEPSFLRVSRDSDGAADSGAVILGGAGVTFNTAGFDIGVSTAMSSPIGAGGITKNGAGSLTLNAVNTYNGNTTVTGGSLTVSNTASLRSFVNAGSANLIGGSGAILLNGGLAIDTTFASISDGRSWLLVDVANLTETYGAGFNVPGYTESSPGVWTRVQGANTWTFTEATGALVLDINPNVSTFVLQTRGPGPAGNVQSVWTTNGVSELPTAGNNRLNAWGIIGANDRVLMSFDLSAISAAAGGSDVVVRNARVEAVRSSWATGWASTSLHTAVPFDPLNTTWNSSVAVQENYIGDIGGPGAFTMTWDSRFAGTDPWNSDFDNLVPDVQGDLDNNRTADYLLRVNPGNEWSAVLGVDTLRLVVDVEYVSPFRTWMEEYPSIPLGLRGPGDDPDGDGVLNLTEFAFKGNPSSGNDNGLSSVLLQDMTAPAGNELTLVIATRDGATFVPGAAGVQTATVAADQLTYIIEGSTDLVFPSAAVSHVLVSDTAPGLPDLTGTAWEYHTFRLDASEGLPGKGFLRAKVTSP